MGGKHPNGVIQLDKQLDREVRRIAEMTRTPISRVLNELVSYALNNCQLKPVQLYSLNFKEGKTK